MSENVNEDRHRVELAMKQTKATERQAKTSGKKAPSLHIRKPKPSLLNVSLSEIAAKARLQAPQEDWDRVPTDLAANLDKYLYSAPPQDKI